MEHFIGLSAWNIVTKYFFLENNQLIFIHSIKFQTVDENGYLKKPQKFSELRCYYENNKLIKSVGTFNNDQKIDYLKEYQNLKNDLKNYKNSNSKTLHLKNP